MHRQISLLLTCVGANKSKTVKLKKAIDCEEIFIHHRLDPARKGKSNFYIKCRSKKGF